MPAEQGRTTAAIDHIPILTQGEQRKLWTEKLTLSTCCKITLYRRVGFRSLYVGLESASERVLALMRKPNKRATIVRNLTDATNAGIWMHCSLFFGFPGETEDDAKETYEFILKNDAIIGSFGCGSFSLEHNAPIFRHLEDFPVHLVH